MIRPLTLTESASFVGKISYVELQLFSVLAKQAALADEPYEQVFLSSASAAHAWRSRQLFELLPISVGLANHDELIRPFDSNFDELLIDLIERETVADLLVILLQEIYPTLLSVYDVRLELCCYPADGAAKRVFQRVKEDLKSVLSELDHLLQLPVGLTPVAATAERRIVTILRQLLPTDV